MLNHVKCLLNLGIEHDSFVNETEIINKEYHPNSWNIYTFYAGDGENWNDDNEKAINLLNTLKETNQMLVYAEINDKRVHPEEESDNVPDWNSPSFVAWGNENPASIWTLCVPLMDNKFKNKTRFAIFLFQ